MALRKSAGNFCVIFHPSLYHWPISAFPPLMVAIQDILMGTTLTCLPFHFCDGARCFSWNEIHFHIKFIFVVTAQK
jgi:hypothetical protein